MIYPLLNSGVLFSELNFDQNTVQRALCKTVKQHITTNLMHLPWKRLQGARNLRIIENVGWKEALDTI